MKESEIRIKPYSAAHRQQCIDAFISNIPEFFIERELKEFKEWLDLEEKENTTAANQIHRYFVIEYDRKVAGCGGYFIERKTMDARMTWGLVHRSFHRKGLGKELLLHRINEITLLYPGCTISLDTTQHSFPFFEKLGFAVIKITENYYAEGMHRYDMVLK